MSTLWSELVRVGYKAYRETWLHLLESLYLDHFHPGADRTLSEGLDTLRKQAARSPGRRQALSEEKLSIRRRYKELLAECTAIHGIVQDCFRKNLGAPEIRRVVFQRIYGRRFDKHVLTSGGAWEMIPYSKVARLHDPTSWVPHQLAIALVAKERGTEYQTIEKNTAYLRKLADHK